MIVTDHAPHSEEEKAKPMAQAPSGITGLETSLALGIYSLVEPGYITLMDLMKLMSKNPAEFYRMVPGSVEPEAPADLVIFGEKNSGQWIILHQRQPTVRSKAGPCQERFITLSARERLRIKVSGLDKSPQLCMTIYVGHISTVGGFIFIYFYLRNNQQVFHQGSCGCVVSRSQIC